MNSTCTSRHASRFGKCALFVLVFLPFTASTQLSHDSEAISREVSVFNFGQPSAEVEAISREVSVFNFGQPLPTRTKSRLT